MIIWYIINTNLIRIVFINKIELKLFLPFTVPIQMIRSPDNYKTECLVNPTNHSSNHFNHNLNIPYKDQMKLALELSRQDYSDEMEQMEQMEEQQLMELHLSQCKEREKQTTEILLKLKRVSKYDKELSEILNRLEYIFHLYSNSLIEYYSLGENKDHIWKHLTQIRFTQEEKDFLKKVLC